MARLVAFAACLLLLFASTPLAVALAYAALTPAVLAPALAGAQPGRDLPDDQTDGPGRPGLGTGQGGGDRAAVLAWANARVGLPYRMGAAGPSAWDCSSFTQAAYAQLSVRLPRTAQAQRDWLAAGHGTRIPPGREQPADLIFWDSYLGPAEIGHVVLVDDPADRRTVEAHNTRSGTGRFTYSPAGHHRYEIWRPTVSFTAPAGGR